MYDPRAIVVQVMALLVAITFHELAHGWSAYRLGDNTALQMGRLTLNPLAHIDIFGTVILPGLLIITGSPVLFGWAKPVPVNPARFRNPRKGMSLVSLSGPATNLGLAVLAAVILKTGMVRPSGGVATPIFEFLWFSLSINVILAIFNLMPIPPLDGAHLLEGFLPEGAARQFSRLEPYGMIIIIAMLYLGLFRLVLMPIYRLIMSILH
jgi:Zn-dependent protease